MIEELEPIPISVELIQFQELLIVFADGAKIIFKHENVEFSANFCDTSLFDPYGTFEDASKALYPGRKFLVTVFLNETAKGHYAKKIPDEVPPEIQEVATLDWIIKGKTISDAVDGSILVDCGIPILTFSSEEINKKGEYGEWFGELRVWIAD